MNFSARIRAVSRRQSASTIAPVLALVLLVGACSSSDGSGTATTAATTAATSSSTTTTGKDRGTKAPSDVYADPANWLCRPDRSDDACDIDLDATLVAVDGKQTVEPFTPAKDPPVDCFYVYPTISTDPGENSDRVPGEAEIGIAANQAARFAEYCNVYAPMYRQIPLAALFNRISSGESTTTAPAGGAESPSDIAYGDVLDAFRYYMVNDNDGRPFVLIGHSQGAGHLARLIAEVIDGDKQLRSQLLSAMLMGAAITIKGGDNNSFEHVSGCESAEDTHCVISYASFYAGEPPPKDSFFARPRSGGGRALCTDPADPGSTEASPLSSYFQAGHAEGAPAVSTPWIHYEGLVTGQCVNDGPFDWLQITNTAKPGSAWPTELGGRITPQWGTHLLDMNFSMGDLVDLVGTQSGQD